MDSDPGALARRFEAIDEQVDALVAATGLACPSGCGACCLSPEVEAAPEELELLAQEWVRRGEARALLDRLAALEAEGRRQCALYRPSSEDGRQGRCGAYAWRPLVCRLFGFAARHDRRGQPELVLCAVMSAAAPEATAQAARQVAAGAPAPLFGDHAHGLIADLGGRGSERLPINQALRQALERALLHARLAAGE